MPGFSRAFAWQCAVTGFRAERKKGRSPAHIWVLTCLLCFAPGCDRSLELFDAAPPEDQTTIPTSAIDRFMVLHVENDASRVRLTHPRETEHATPRVGGELFINPDDLRQSTGVIRWYAATVGPRERDGVTSRPPPGEVTLRLSKVASASVRRLAELRPDVSERVTIRAVLEANGETRDVDVELLVTADIRDGQLSGVGLELSRPVTLSGVSSDPTQNAGTPPDNSGAAANWELSGRVVARASSVRESVAAEGR
jgi:hypothetical protein